jgi:hypothetical protein
MSSVPIRHVQDGVQRGLGVLRTQSRICSSVSTSRPGESSPPLNGSKAGASRNAAGDRIASIHSRRSFSVER